jgi:hexosaminidase
MADRQPLDVLPAPREVKVEDGHFSAPPRLSVALRSATTPRLAAAAVGAQTRWIGRTGPSTGEASYLLTVECAAKGSDVPALGEDESYTLSVAKSGAVLHAATDLGALRGIETFLQLLGRDSGGNFLPAVEVVDRPRFAWRGLLIDVSRHWEPMEVIERNIDAMAVVKLNVLHLHLTDDQGFRIESLTHPELQAQGSDGNYYTQAQMRAIIRYAADRGIRVVPEFDVPGHSTSWVVSHPELASLPGPYGIERWWGVFNPVLDPTKEATYALLADFLGEMAALFPDQYLHIGGDENNGVQWSANPRIQAFIREHGLKDNAGLHAYFNRRLTEIVSRHGKRIVGWDEIINPALPASSTIESWRGADGLVTATALGYDCILANGYYIDFLDPAAAHYAVDPSPSSTHLTPAQRSHILGGEATMWAERVFPETIDSRIWPRTAAIAERLWSSEDVRDTEDMYRRLAIVSVRLTEAGARHERNRDVMLKHLVGENLQIAGIDSLRTFIDLIEPSKRYSRGSQQIWLTQLVPLTYISDAAMPESDVSREFSHSVSTLLSSGPGIDGTLAGEIDGKLKSWSDAASNVADTMSGTYPALLEAITPGHAIADACGVGREAVQSLRSGIPISKERLAAVLSRLDRDAEPNGSSTVIPILRPMRLLAAAAALQGERASMTQEAWFSKISAAADSASLNASLE